MQKLLSDPKNTLTEEELRVNMHPSCGCLNLNDPYLYNTLHPGGGEELLRRCTLREPERKILWDEQREVVERLRKAQHPDGVDTMYMIQEESEGRICFNVDGDYIYTPEEPRPCF